MLVMIMMPVTVMMRSKVRPVYFKTEYKMTACFSLFFLVFMAWDE